MNMFNILEVLFFEMKNNTWGYDINDINDIKDIKIGELTQYDNVILTNANIEIINLSVIRFLTSKNEINIYIKNDLPVLIAINNDSKFSQLIHLDKNKKYMSNDKEYFYFLFKYVTNFIIDKTKIDIDIDFSIYNDSVSITKYKDIKASNPLLNINDEDNVSIYYCENEYILYNDFTGSFNMFLKDNIPFKITYKEGLFEDDEITIWENIL